MLRILTLASGSTYYPNIATIHCRLSLVGRPLSNRYTPEDGCLGLAPITSPGGDKTVDAIDSPRLPV
jgi:hypothetical protein